MGSRREAPRGDGQWPFSPCTCGVLKSHTGRRQGLSHPQVTCRDRGWTQIPQSRPGVVLSPLLATLPWTVVTFPVIGEIGPWPLLGGTSKVIAVPVLPLKDSGFVVPKEAQGGRRDPRGDLLSWNPHSHLIWEPAMGPGDLTRKCPLPAQAGPGGERQQTWPLAVAPGPAPGSARRRGARPGRVNIDRPGGSPGLHLVASLSSGPLPEREAGQQGNVSRWLRGTRSPGRSWPSGTAESSP